MNKIVIYGKDTWPFTNDAREAYAKKGIEIDYINVIENPIKLDEMLKFSNGVRKLPVIIENDIVSIGYKGGSWGI